MKEYLNGNDPAVRHHWGFLRGIPDQVIIEFLFEILAEPVRQIEYLCNFVFYGLSGKVLIINVLDNINVIILPQITYPNI